MIYVYFPYYDTHKFTRVNCHHQYHHQNEEYHKPLTTSTGRKLALVEGVNHDLVCAGSNYHVHFAWQVWHGQYSPGFKFNRLKSFSRVEIDRTRVDLKDSRGKGFALRRLNKHNFCPASVCSIYQQNHNLSDLDRTVSAERSTSCNKRHLSLA